MPVDGQVPGRSVAPGCAARCAVVGAKNSALKLMAAALLAVGRTALTNVPAIVDVDDHGRAAAPARLHGRLRRGRRRRRDRRAGARRPPGRLRPGPGAARVDLRPRPARRPLRPGRRRRARRRRDRLARARPARRGPGDARRDGARRRTATSSPRRRRGCTAATVRLDFPSVGATENVLMAAVLASGHTRLIDNAAREPEIVDIAELLQRDGRAASTGAGTSTIEVEGVDALHADRRTTSCPTASPPAPGRSPPRPPAVTSRSSGQSAEHLEISLDLLAHAGAEVATTPRRVPGRRLRAPAASVDVATLPYPGSPPTCSRSRWPTTRSPDGSAMITENLFEARFRTVQELARLGADARVDGHHVMVHGVAAAVGRAGRGQRHPRRRRARRRRSGRGRGHHGERRPPRRPGLRAVRRGELQGLGADVVREPDDDAVRHRISRRSS